MVDPTLRIAYLVRTVSNVLTLRIEQALRPVGLTQPQLATLTHLALSAEDGLSGAELGRRAEVTSQSMSRALAELRRRGLVTKTPHPTHGRVIEIRITDAGRALVERAQELTDAVDTRVLGLLHDDEPDRLRTLLTRVAAGLGLPSGVEPRDPRASET